MRNAGLDESQTGIKIAGRNISNLRYADNTTLMAESEEELKSLLMKVKEESEKVGLENFERYFASVWDECNCVIVWAVFGIAFLWDPEGKMREFQC